MRSKLIAARHQQGLTQEEVAKTIGVTRACYSNYEKGTRNPPLQRIIELKKILNITEDEFFLVDCETNR